MLPALSQTFLRFARSGQAGGALLLLCTAGALILANSPLGAGFEAARHATVGPLSVAHWINDALMAVFFLLVGLELERESVAASVCGLLWFLVPGRARPVA